MKDDACVVCILFCNIFVRLLLSLSIHYAANFSGEAYGVLSCHRRKPSIKANEDHGSARRGNGQPVPASGS